MSSRRRLLRAVAPRLMPYLGETTLFVPVPVAGQAVKVAREAHPGLVAPSGAAPHVTVMYPFVRAYRLLGPRGRRLRRLIAGVAPFTACFDRIDRFPDVLYLAPRDPAPFRALTDAVSQAWPGIEPYQGRHASVIPHLTVSEGPEPPGLARRVEAELPIEAAVREVWLAGMRADGTWRTLARYPLDGG